VVEVEGDELWLAKGTDGRRPMRLEIEFDLSELRLNESKWPERFSRSDACKAYPLSLRCIFGDERPDPGKGGKFAMIGESCDDLGLLILVVFAVVGRSALFARLLPACRNALKTGPLRVASAPAEAPNAVEVSPTSLARLVDTGLALQVPVFSDAKASNGNASAAYSGGPVATPYL
jgi:hypothetical protein